MNHSTHPTTSVFHHLIGKWMLERHITDKLSNSTAKASGFASITQKSHSVLEYLEDIHVKWSTGFEHPATKHYKYILQEDGKLSQYNPVGKEDGSEDFERMYDLDFYEEDGKLKAIGDFLCGCDMYKAEYVFDSMKKFKLSYDVKGPKKDYETLTIFVKCNS